MNYLLIDLEKSPTKWRKIPFHRAKVGLFATFKAAKRMIAPEEPHAIYVLPRKKAAQSIAAAAAEILSHHADARIAVVSPRKKLPAAVADLQARYPQAQLLLRKRIGSKVRRFLKQNEHRLPETAAQTDADEAEIITTAADRVQAAVAEIMPPQQVFTLLNTDKAADPQEDADMAAALRVLKKNRPKKKTDLVRLISGSVQHNEAQARQIVAQLQTSGVIAVDAAENVRYR